MSHPAISTTSVHRQRDPRDPDRQLPNARLEPWSYLRDLLCVLPHWPHSRVLELAPVYWRQLKQEDAQQLLRTDVCRQVMLDLDGHAAAK